MSEGKHNITNTSQCNEITSGYVFTPFHLFGGLLVCKQDFTNTTKQIPMKLGGKVWYGSGKKLFYFDSHPDQGPEPGSFFSLS